MLQYLLNATAIWLISLVLFDLFLRRESYHNYNRFYLLFTFMLGALFPLVQWQGESNIYPTNLKQPIAQVITVKQNVINAATPSSINWEQWPLIVYVTGAAVMTLLLLIEVVKLLVVYRSGKRTSQQSWTVIETGKEHAPFSLLHLLFVSNIAQYDEDEWSMILIHERRHTTLLHFADLLVIQLARIIFWFHPLVYIYNKRLLLVHEYQADSASAERPLRYGKFLIEQALLQTAPTISHSFNRSPIKKRIVMLTRKSSAASRTKMLVFVPLALVCIVCFSKNSFSQRLAKKGNTVTWRGNTFELSKEVTDTIIIIDPVTGKGETIIEKRDPEPIKMNGKTISWDRTEIATFTSDNNNIRTYLLKNLRNELGALKDGAYTLTISNILIDENGKVVFFNYHEMKRSRPIEEVKPHAQPAGPRVINAADPKIQVSFGPGSPTGIGSQPVALHRNTDPAYYEEIDKDMQQAIFNKISDLLETAPAFIPAKLNGKNVISKYDSQLLFWNSFKIKDHKIYELQKDGTFKEL